MSLITPNTQLRVMGRQSPNQNITINIPNTKTNKKIGHHLSPHKLRHSNGVKDQLAVPLLTKPLKCVNHIHVYIIHDADDERY